MTDNTVNTIQLTGKRFKAQILLATFLMLSGIPIAASIPTEHSWIGVLATITGLSWLLVAKFKAWWHHG